MPLTLRARMFLSTLMVIVTVLMVNDVVLEEYVQSAWIDATEKQIIEHAHTTRQALLLSPERLASESPAQLDPIVDALAEANETRVTLIASDGTVIGDSSLTIGQILKVDNHQNRPEVRDAMRQTQGMARRYSTTVNADLLYVALPYTTLEGQRGIVRVSRPLIQLQETTTRLRKLILFAFVFGVAGAVLLSWLVSHWVTIGVERILKRATDISTKSSGDAESVNPLELNDISTTVQSVVEEFEHTLKRLHQEQERLSAVLQGIREAVVVIDPNHRIVLLNDQASEFLRLDSDVLGQPAYDVITDSKLKKLIRKGLKGKTGDISITTKKPFRRSAVAHAAPLPNGEVLLVILDITETVRLERVRRDFVANVSHELRNPLSVVRATAETLPDAPQASQAKLLKTLIRNAERMSAIVTDLLDLSRIEAGQYDLEPMRLNVRECVENSIQSTVERIASRQHELDVQIDNQLDCVADRTALEQVLVNLIDNAAKYTPEKGNICVRAFALGEETARIEVQDNGPGISKKYRERVFERFYRVDKGAVEPSEVQASDWPSSSTLSKRCAGRWVSKKSPPEAPVFGLSCPVAKKPMKTAPPHLVDATGRCP